MSEAIQGLLRTASRVVAIIMVIFYMVRVDVMVADLFVGVLLLVFVNESAIRSQREKSKNLHYFVKNLSTILIHIAANESGMPLAARVMKDIAMIFPSIGDRKEAEALFQNAIALCQSHLGEGHSDYVELVEHYRLFTQRKKGTRGKKMYR